MLPFPQSSPLKIQTAFEPPAKTPFHFLRALRRPKSNPIRAETPSAMAGILSGIYSYARPPPREEPLEPD